MANNDNPEFLQRNDRGVEVRDLIAHLQTLDPTARIVYSADEYTETPVDAKDFTRQASGLIEIRIPKELVSEMEWASGSELDDLERENGRLEISLKDNEEKLNNLESVLVTIRRTVSEALED